MAEPRSLRIAMATEQFLPYLGGGQVHAHELARALGRLGHHVTIHCRRRPGTAAEEEGDGYRIVRLGPPDAGRSLPSQAAYTLRAVRRIARDHRSAPYDLVHGHVHQGTAVSSLAGRRLRIPAVGTVHGLHQSQPGALRADSRQPAAALLERVALRFRQDAWITVSADAVPALVAAGARRDRILVLGNGVDTQRFRPAPSSPPTPPRPPTVGFVGRLAAVKGLPTAVAALRLLRAEVPDARLALVGEGPERAGIEELARREGLAGAVEVRPPLPYARAHEAYQGFDAFALPSLTEGHPLVILEAMACGLPVVATRVGGVPGLVEEGVTGALVEPGDSAGLARALAPYLADPARRLAAGRAARERALRHSWPHVAAATVAWYRDVLATAPP